MTPSTPIARQSSGNSKTLIRAGNVRESGESFGGRRSRRGSYAVFAGRSGTRSQQCLLSFQARCGLLAVAPVRRGKAGTRAGGATRLKQCRGSLSAREVLQGDSRPRPCQGRV